MAMKTNQPRRRVNWRNAHNAQTIGLVQKQNKLAIKACFTDGLLHPSNPPPPHLHARSAKSHSQVVLPWTATRRKTKNVTILSSTRNKRPREQEQLNQDYIRYVAPTLEPKRWWRWRRYRRSMPCGRLRYCDWRKLLLSWLAVKIVKIGSILFVLVLVIELRRSLTLLIVFVMTVAHKLLLS